MQIATHHAKSERVRAGIKMEKWLFLHWIALNSSNIPEGHAKLSTLVEADLTNAAAPSSDRTTMPTRDAANALPFNAPKLTGYRKPVKDLSPVSYTHLTL